MDPKSNANFYFHLIYGEASSSGEKIEISAENIILENNQMESLPRGKYVKVSIKDHGMGIPKEHLKKIIDPFFTTKPEGSGLGLASAFTIIKKHGGTVTVSSEIKSGTIFSFYLPASNKANPRSKSEEIPLIKGMGRILLMDDEELVLEATSEMLKKLGYEVIAACEGSEAVSAYLKAQELMKPFDVVILDLTVW